MTINKYIIHVLIEGKTRYSVHFIGLVGEF